MNNEIELMDIADDLFILNKTSVERLFRLENGADCLALYAFYYKTAKWQKTNQVKATDTYVMKCLKWSRERLKRTKDILRENGFIEIIQGRADGKIAGWYVRVKFIVTTERITNAKIVVADVSKTTDFQQVENATCDEPTTNALKEQTKCLKKTKEILKEQQESELDSEFDELWKEYPRKIGRQSAYKAFCRARKSGVDKDTILNGITAYNAQIKANKTRPEYIKHGSTWFNQECWNDDYAITQPTLTSPPSGKPVPEWIQKLSKREGGQK